MSLIASGRKPRTGTAPSRLAALVLITRAALSTRRPVLGSRAQLTSVLLRVIAAALLSWIGAIHLHLWQEGYKFIPTSGPLFLVDAIAAFALALAVLTRAAPAVGLAAVGFTAATLGALVVSLTAGLFGFRESISASFVVLSIVIESVAIVTLTAWAAVVALATSQQPARRSTAGSPTPKL